MAFSYDLWCLKQNQIMPDKMSPISYHLNLDLFIIIGKPIQIQIGIRITKFVLPILGPDPPSFLTIYNLSVCVF